MNGHAYPVRVDATLDADLSRWLWLVKWLLAIPHYIVLVFLWAAFVVLSIVAWVAILVTGRYPRAIFDFNVGVLRWSWRVTYYTYGGLGTDHYPPFSLEDRPDYPAHLEIEYPEHLSRGLALVKSWLLAIPHYLVTAIFLGTGWYVATDGSTDNASRAWSGGLIGLLVFVAAVVLLFTGRYPVTIFDLVLGLNRWVLRVAAYAALMTDDYPPFRLDLGGTDPGTGVLTLGSSPTTDSGAGPGTSTGSGPGSGTPPAAAPPAPTATQATPQTAPVESGPPGAPPGPPYGPPPPPPRSRWGAGRVIAVIVGAVLAFTSLGMLAAGGVLRLADDGIRDSQGYLMSSSVEFRSPGYAATSPDVELRSGTPLVDVPERWLGTVKVEADSRTSNGVFIGIARTSDVVAYLDGVAHSTVQDPFGGDQTPNTDFTDGGSPGRAPQDASFWVASARGQGQQTLTWKAESGNWTLVVMNGEGTTPVAADVSAGATIPILGDIAIALLIAGLIGAAISAVILVAALNRPRTTA